MLQQFLKNTISRKEKARSFSTILGSQMGRLNRFSRQFMALLENQTCQHCRRPQDKSTAFCVACWSQLLHRDPVPVYQMGRTSIYAATLFNPMIKELIYRYKFYDRADYTERLVTIFSRYWKELLLASGQSQEILKNTTPDELLSNDVKPTVLVTVIPSHKAEEASHLAPVARVFAQQFGYQFMPNLLSWQRPVQPQHKLKGRQQRFENLKDAFQFNRPMFEASGCQTILILDDLTTTGATFQTACQLITKNTSAAVSLKALALTCVVKESSHY